MDSCFNGLGNMDYLLGELLASLSNGDKLFSSCMMNVAIADGMGPTSWSSDGTNGKDCGRMLWSIARAVNCVKNGLA
jgi:hypothetical protein